MRHPLAAPIALAAGAMLLAGGAWLTPVPLAHAAPALTATVCADAQVNLGAVTDDLNDALAATEGLTTTVDELTRRLGLPALLGTAKADNDAAVVKIRAVLSLRAAQVLAQDRVDVLCRDQVDITISPAPSSPPSSRRPSSGGYQVPLRPRRAPETGDGSRQPTGAENLGDVATRSIAPAMALYALLGVGISASVYAARLWLLEA
jgi:hypothetical protein